MADLRAAVSVATILPWALFAEAKTTSRAVSPANSSESLLLNTPSRSDGESAAFDANLALLGERYAWGEMGDSVCQIRLNELRNERTSQQAAHQTAGNGALVDVVLSVVICILYFIFIAASESRTSRGQGP